jgi:NAD(P)-dependent dehydrogenase (short-subunit alcohol dehydrogenase family)
MAGLLEGKVAIVTGAAQGIGLACAETFAAAGAKVVVSDLDESAAKAAAEPFGGEGVACDVRDEAAVQQLVAGTVERHGGLHVAVANAGVGFAQPVTAMSLEDWRRVTSVNLDGVFLTLRYAGEHMAGNGGGSLVTIASATATAGSPLLAHYASAKAGAVNLTQTVAQELRGHGVRANAILPGFIETELVKKEKQNFMDMLGLDDFDGLIAQKQGRYGTEGEVAKLALFLASDRSSFCNAGAYLIDGGLTASLL